MRVLLTIFASCHYILSVNGISSEAISVNDIGENVTSVNISCSANDDLIHVKSIEYLYNQESDCNTEPCGQPLTNSSTGLTSPCTGQSSCTQRIPNDDNCTGSTIRYRCIASKNIKDMCDKDFELEGSDMIFLSSPQYPGLVNGLTEESCECSIRGTNITSITILDLTLKTTSNGTRSNLFIQYGDMRYNKTSRDNSQSPLQVYNHRLQTTTTTADIIFTHQQINEQKLWIEIQGEALTGNCTRGTALSTTHSEISTSTTAYPTKENTTTTSTVTNDTSTDVPSTRPSNHTENTTASGTANNHNMSSETSSERPTSSTVNSSEQADHDLYVIIGCTAGGLVLILILVTVSVVFRIRRNKANVRQQNLDYLELGVPDPDEQQGDISTKLSPMATRHIPEYAVVNKNGKRFNVAGGNRPNEVTKSGETDVSDMEILENDLYVPFEPPNNHGASSTNVTSTDRQTGEMEIMENDLYVPFESSSNPYHPDTSPTNAIPTDLASGEMEILENDLYVPFESPCNSCHPDASSANVTPLNRASGEMEIIENDLYVPFEVSTSFKK